MSASPELLWLVLQNGGSNSFLIHSKNRVFTKEPNNLVNVNSFKFSGLVQPKAIGVEAAPDNKGVIVTVQKKKALNSPSKRYARTQTRGGTRHAVKTVYGITEKSGYRPDLQHFALARVSAIIESQKTAKHKPVKTSRKNLKEQK